MIKEYFTPETPKYVFNMLAPESGSFLLTRGTGFGSQGYSDGVDNTGLFINININVPMVLTHATIILGEPTVEQPNGANGYFDIGIYDATGTKIISTGSVQRSLLSSGVNDIDITDTPIGPGEYYLAFSSDNGSMVLIVDTTHNSDSSLMRSGIRGMENAFPLPTTLNLASGPMTNSALRTPFWGFKLL